MEKDWIFERASVRSFTDEPVAKEDLERLLRAAMAAPSATNQQPWEFWVVTGPGRLEALSACSPYAGPTKRAAAAIVPCIRTEGILVPEMEQQDMGAAVENLLLEATRLGLGAVWQGIYPDQERASAVARVLGIEGRRDIVPFAIVAVGHPARRPAPTGPSRFDPSRIHWDQKSA